MTRQSPAPERVANDARLLYTRKEAARLLCIDISFVKRLEKSGALKGLRLNRSPTAMVFFTRDNLLRVIEEAADAS